MILVSKDEWLYGRAYLSEAEKKWHPFPETCRDFGPKLRRTVHGVRHWCPACNKEHHIAIFKANPKTQAMWRWDGNTERPTFDPCVRALAGTVTLCHYTITSGVVNFSEECPHDLHGRSVELPDWPLVTPLEVEAMKARRLLAPRMGFMLRSPLIGKG